MMATIMNYTTVAKTIIKRQESIVGPLAWTEASKVGGVTVSGNSLEVVGDGKKVLEALVMQYKTLFGQASVEACKDAVAPLMEEISKEQMPSILL